MKHKILLSVLFVCFPVFASAILHYEETSATIDNISYNLTYVVDNQAIDEPYGYAEVTGIGISDAVIPRSVQYNGFEYDVFCISNLGGVRSVTIPPTVTFFGSFYASDAMGEQRVNYNLHGQWDSLKDIYMQSKYPITLEDDWFTESVYANATLHVPQGSKTNYQSKPYWQNFKNIVEIGSEEYPEEPVVTTSESNVLSAGPVKIVTGKSATIDINLTNESTDLTAYQFDLVLPEDVTIAGKGNGEFMVTKGDRYADNEQSLTVTKVGDNTYRFVCFSMSNALISGTEGAILNVVLQADKSVKDGTYQARITNAIMTKVDDTQLKLADVGFSIEVSSFVPGDVNGDGKIDVLDIMETVNYIMESPSSDFVFAAADMNGDKEINVTDIVKIVKVIMNGGNAGSRAQSAEGVGEDNWLSLDTQGNNTFTINLHNDATYVAAQMEITLADGQQLKDISLDKHRCNGHQIVCLPSGDNSYRVLMFSMTNEGFSGNEGSILSFVVDGIAGGFKVDNILVASINEAQQVFPSLYSSTTGIKAIDNKQEATIFSIDGKRLENPQRGMNVIKDGQGKVKKVVVN